MSVDARQYLLNRFESDATTLRARAAQLKSSAQQAPGPDAATSMRMADACDRVAGLVRNVRAGEKGIVLQDLAALTLPLEDLARQHTKEPAVRAVYAGAATRIREMLQAEADEA